MRQAHAEIVARGFAAYAAGDRARLIAVLHPEAELLPLSADLTSNEGPYYGRLGAEQWLENLGSAAAAFTGEPDQIRESGDTVLVLGRIQIEPGPGGKPRTQRVGWVVRVQDDLIISFRGYLDQDDAERAAGFCPRRGCPPAAT